MAFDQRESRTQPVGVTAPKEPLGFWASYRAVRRNVLELIPEQAYRQPVLTGGRRKGWMMLMDPPALERVFRGNVANYPKSPVARRLMTPREGENLIIAEGQSWRWQRRTMSPMFQPKALKAMSPVMSVAGASAADRIGAQDAEVVDVYPEVIAATCDVICDLALSGRDAINRAALTNAIEGYLRNIARVSLLDLLGAPSWVPRPGTLLNRDGPHMDRMTDEIIAARRARGPSDPPDILDMMLAANDPETGAEMDPVTMRNNLLGLLFAGHETTALAITWSLYLLALHQGAQDRARDEAQAAITGDPEAEIDPAKLGYARQVIEEALRLYPPAGFLTRTALEADELAGHEVKAGATVILPIYAVHRHQLLWERPESFDPDRFAPGAAEGRHRSAFLPFGAGPRICMGWAFAMMEAQIILGTLLARFRFTLPDGFQPVPRMWFTLRPGTGMPLRVERV